MNTQKFELMSIAGQHLHEVREKTAAIVKPGMSLVEIDAYADKLITAFGDYPSFKTVRGYHHATCINLNEGIVHGIPNTTLVKPGDVISIDMGLIHKNYQSDTSITFQVPPVDDKTTRFLQVGKDALNAAIKVALPGNTIYDISSAIQRTVEAAGYSAIRDLTGHGIGKQMHESPSIPCFADPYYKKVIIKPGQALAIEVMYAMGSYRLITDDDGWTIRTADRSLTGLFEDTVFITPTANQVLT